MDKLSNHESLALLTALDHAAEPPFRVFYKIRMYGPPKNTYTVSNPVSGFSCETHSPTEPGNSPNNATSRDYLRTTYPLHLLLTLESHWWTLILPIYTQRLHSTIERIKDYTSFCHLWQGVFPHCWNDIVCCTIQLNTNSTCVFVFDLSSRRLTGRYNQFCEDSPAIFSARSSRTSISLIRLCWVFIQPILPMPIQFRTEVINARDYGFHLHIAFPPLSPLYKLNGEHADKAANTNSIRSMLNLTMLNFLVGWVTLTESRLLAINPFILPDYV